MKTDIQEVENEKNTVILKVEVPSEDIADSINKAYKEISEKVKIPGFRKGKIPPQVIDRMIGKDAVLNEALNDLIPLFYPKAVESSGIDPVSMPQIDIKQLEDDKPLIFTAKVQVRPEVELGDYKEITLPEQTTKATKEEVDKQLNSMRDKFAQLEPVSKRALKKGDYALIDFEGFMNGKPFEGGSGTDYMLEIGSGTFIPGFEDQLVGAKRGEERDINVTFPDDYQAEFLAGHDAVFNVKVKEIKEKKLPKIDDDFAKNVSQFETLAELKKDVKKTIEEKKKSQANFKRRNEVVEYVADRAKVDLPSALIERQMDIMLEDLEDTLKRQKTDISVYLAQMGDDKQHFRESFRNESTKRVKQNLVLEAVTKAENIDVGDEDVEAEIRKLAEGSNQDFDDLKAQMTEEHIDYLKDRLRLMKTVDFLESKVKYVKKDEKK